MACRFLVNLFGLKSVNKYSNTYLREQWYEAKSLNALEVVFGLNLQCIHGLAYTFALAVRHWQHL